MSARRYRSRALAQRCAKIARSSGDASPARQRVKGVETEHDRSASSPDVNAGPRGDLQRELSDAGFTFCL
jgi:hypothetical protein